MRECYPSNTPTQTSFLYFLTNTENDRKGISTSFHSCHSFSVWKKTHSIQHFCLSCVNVTKNANNRCTEVVPGPFGFGQFTSLLKIRRKLFYPEQSRRQQLKKKTHSKPLPNQLQLLFLCDLRLWRFIFTRKLFFTLTFLIWFAFFFGRLLLRLFGLGLKFLFNKTCKWSEISVKLYHSTFFVRRNRCNVRCWLRYLLFRFWDHFRFLISQLPIIERFLLKECITWQKLSIFLWKKKTNFSGCRWLRLRSFLFRWWWSFCL